MTVPTILHATVQDRINANGILRYDIHADDGYLLYRKSDYNRAVAIGYPEATYFCDYMNVGENEDFFDIATMPALEAEKIMKTITEVL